MTSIIECPDQIPAIGFGELLQLLMTVFSTFRKFRLSRRTSAFGTKADLNERSTRTIQSSCSFLAAVRLSKVEEPATTSDQRDHALADSYSYRLSVDLTTETTAVVTTPRRQGPEKSLPTQSASR